MKKLKWMMPLVASATILTPLATITSCGNGNEDEPDIPETDTLEWDFTTGEYQSKVKAKTGNPIKSSQAIYNFLKDADKNPFIFLNDFFLLEDATYRTVSQTYNFEKYYIKVKINDIDYLNQTISYNIVTQIIGESKVDNGTEIQTELNMSFEKIPLIANARYNSSQSGKPKTLWSFIPKYTPLTDFEFIDYFMGLTNGWTINGSFYEKDGDNIIDIGFDHMDRKKLVAKGSFESNEIVAIEESSLVDVYSQYYSKIDIAVDYDINNPIPSDIGTALIHENIRPVEMFSTLCFSVDTSLIPAEEFDSNFGFFIETGSFIPNKRQSFVASISINDHYVGEFETFEHNTLMVTIPLVYGDKIKFVLYISNEWIPQQIWNIAFGLLRHS